MNEPYEKPEQFLEEWVAELRKEIPEPKDVARKIFEEAANINDVDVKKLSELLNMGRFEIGRIKANVSRKRTGEEKRRKEEEAKQKEEIWKTAPDANAILKHILESHPDVNDKQKEEIISWAELKGTLHPLELGHLLQNMRGVGSATANIIAQKYGVALQKAASEGSAEVQMLLTTWQQQGQQTPFPPGVYPGVTPTPRPPTVPQPAPFQQTPQPYVPSTYPPAQYPPAQPVMTYTPPTPPAQPQRETKEEKVTKEDIMKIVNEAVRAKDEESRLDRLEQVITGLGNEFDGIKEALIKGKGKSEESSKPVPEVKPEDIARVASESATKAVTEYLRVKETEDKTEKRHQELLSAISGQRAVQVASADWKSDEGRIIGLGLQQVGEAVKDKQPVRIIVEGVPKLLGQPAAATPPPKEVEVGAQSSLEKRLPPELVRKD